MSKGNAILGRKDLHISGSSQQGSVGPGKPGKGPGEPVPGKRGHVSLLVSEGRISCFVQGSQPMGKGLVMSVTLPTSSGVGTQQQGPPLGEGDCAAGLSLAGARQGEAALREAEKGSPGRPRPRRSFARAEETMGKWEQLGGLCSGPPGRVGNTWFHE